MPNPNLASQSSDLRAPYVLALDVGTSSTRALLFDATGAVVPSMLSQHSYQLTTSHEGEVSTDADLLLEKVAQTIDEVLQLAGARAQRIGAVAVDTFWHSLMGVDAANHPLTPVITWEDTRPQSVVAELRAQLDEKTVHERTGAHFHASYWPAKLRWLATHQPETFAQTAQWISFGEYAHRKFLGRSVCSLSMASGTGMLATHARSWDKELMQVLGVRPEQLPTLGDLSDSLVGLSPEYAARWPVLQHVPWFPAVGDGAAACVGSGCVSSHCWSLTVGTSSAMRVVLAPEHIVAPSGLWLYLIDGKRGVLGGALSEGGNIFNWLHTTLKLPDMVQADALVAALKPDGHGLTILPFLSGERSLGWHAEARMTVMGLSLHTSPIDLLRAGIETLAYRLAEVYEQLIKGLQRDEAPTIIGSGGALLGSATLQSVIADTLGVAIYPSQVSEASARGAALLALEALGLIPDITQLSPTMGAPVLPDAQRGEIYREAAARQRRLYKTLLP